MAVIFDILDTRRLHCPKPQAFQVCRETRLDPNTGSSSAGVRSIFQDIFSRIRNPRSQSRSYPLITYLGSRTKCSAKYAKTSISMSIHGVRCCNIAITGKENLSSPRQMKDVSFVARFTVPSTMVATHGTTINPVIPASSETHMLFTTSAVMCSHSHGPASGRNHEVSTQARLSYQYASGHRHPPPTTHNSRLPSLLVSSHRYFLM